MPHRRGVNPLQVLHVQRDESAKVFSQKMSILTRGIVSLSDRSLVRYDGVIEKNTFMRGTFSSGVMISRLPASPFPYGGGAGRLPD
jgi:hypothetical protein